MSCSEAKTRSIIPNAWLLFFCFVVQVVTAASVDCFAQGAVDYTGNGGRHTIQGRIYFPSGRRADAPGLVVRLESLNSAPLSIFTDSSGSFAFKNLIAGTYAIVIDGGEDFEPMREPVYIDDPGSSSIRGRGVTSSSPRTITVPIYLMPKNRIASNKVGVINAVLASAPKAAADLYRSALESSRTGDHKKAVEQLKSAIALYPPFSLALNELGVQYLFLAQPNEAATVLEEAVKLSPDEVTPRLNYGIALLNQNKFSASEEQLRVVVGKNDSLPTAHMYLGISLARQHKLDEAEKELLTAIDKNSSGVALAHRYLGGVYWAKKEFGKAADELEIYLRLMPNAGDAARTREEIAKMRDKTRQ
jgi:Putative Zn-dependent protease, contains TPR repeats